MSWERVLLLIVSPILLAGMVVLYFSFKEIKENERKIESSVIEQKKISDDIMRSSSKWATSEDVEKYARDNKIYLDQIRKDLSKLNADVTSINQVTYSSGGYVLTKPDVSVTKDTKPTNEITCIGVKCYDKYGYLNTTQEISLFEHFNKTNIPFGTVSFSAGQENPWLIKVQDRQYKIYTIVGEDEEGRQIFYNKAKIKVGDKEYDLEASQAETLQNVLKSKISWWNPSVYFGASASAFSRKDFGATASFGFITYGKTKKTPSLSLFQTGIGYGMIQKTPYLFVTPVSYRLGESLPVLKNTYLGASVGIDREKQFYLSASLSTQL